ncbi:MAG: 16S rRNA (cytosine(1402)-N(4))-methyltransferase RsmH [Candidatus Bipolaricaulota bacterium]
MPLVVEEMLCPGPGRTIVDATVGLGGHAELLLERGAQVLGVDRDPEALQTAYRRLSRWGKQVTLVQGDFRNLPTLLTGAGVPPPDGVLMDVGVSSFQLSSPERGFSFQYDGPLDMRMDPAASVTADELVNNLSERELADLLWHLGEERCARRIARRVVRERERAPIRTTRELARLVARCYPPGRQRIHPATRTFQALRMAVNEERPALEEGLKCAVALLRPGGRLCVISFHSLEDRLVKHSFRGWEKEGRVRVLTPKPIRASTQEVAANPRARPAKLRAAEVREVAHA